jgi:hypothetical protein
MAGTLKQCPNCGYKISGGFFSGSYFWVNKCNNCSRYFCFTCNGSNGGKRCPHCYSEKYSKYQEVNRV